MTVAEYEALAALHEKVTAIQTKMHRNECNRGAFASSHSIVLIAHNRSGDGRIQCEVGDTFYQEVGAFALFLLDRERADLAAQLAALPGAPG